MSEAVEAVALSQKRWFLGFFIPILAIPLVSIGAYSTYYHYWNNFPLVSWEFASDFVMDAISLVVCAIPFQIPVYRSTYAFEKEGIGLRRIFRKREIIPYDKILKVEMHIRQIGPVDSEAVAYVKQSAEAILKWAGKKTKDFTTSDYSRSFIMTSDSVYLMSPAKPKAFLKALKKRVPSVSARIIEISGKGKTILELN